MSVGAKGALQDPALQNYMCYLGALERFDLDAAVSCFSPVVEYRHHPFSQGHSGHESDIEWHIARGHEELRKLWLLRGPDTILHNITGFARSGDLCFAEGYTPERANKVTCISIWTVDTQNRIRTYHQYIQWPSIITIGSADIPCGNMAPIMPA